MFVAARAAHQRDSLPHSVHARRNASSHLTHLQERRHNVSWVMCDGPDSLAPLQRNRTCAYGNLLFVDGKFYLLGDLRGDVQMGVYLHNRFSDGLTTGKASHSLFAPIPKPLALSAATARIQTTPLFVGGDLHSNVGHNMLDCVFPAISALARLQAAARRRALRHVANALPAVSALGDAAAATAAAATAGGGSGGGGGGGGEVGGGDFTFLLYDPPPCCPGQARQG